MLNTMNKLFFGVLLSIFNSIQGQNLNFRLPHVANHTINPALIGLGHLDE